MRESLFLLTSLNAIVIRRFFWSVVTLRECGPGTSLCGYVWPTMYRCGIERM